MSYLEFFGVLTGLLAVGLSAFEYISNWVVGLVSVVLMAMLFYQIQLYPDLFLQVFYFITNLIGWWHWAYPKKQEENEQHELQVSKMKTSSYWYLTIVIGVTTCILGCFSQHLHTILPQFFNQPSAYPFIDSFTTILSVFATFLLIRKKIEAWAIWIVVDVICTIIYYLREVKFLSLEYLIFTIIAIFGLVRWQRVLATKTNAFSPIVKKT
jgi:nicotinamide mononucleotide transporter